MKRALVVDDKEENRYFVRVLLEAHGWRVDCARHGGEALVLARQAVPDLVISDLLMPVMDGYSLLRAWRADPQLCATPFLVYTATHTDTGDEQLALQLGADAFVIKPTDPEYFMSRVQTVMSNQPRPATPTALEDAPQVLREYSEVLVRKLEEKTLELEQANRSLQADIAAREAAEAALRESETRFRQIADSIDEAFWLADADQRIVYVSPVYEKIWGRSRAGLLDTPGAWLDGVHPDDKARVAESLANYSDGPWELTHRILRPDGGVRWVRSRANPVMGEDGQPLRLAGITRDVTEYLALEAQLRHAQKLEAMGRIAGGVAHDFNNFLSVILSYTHLVLATLPEQSEHRADVEEIRRAGQRAAALTRQLLAFGRQQILAPRVIDLNEAVGGCEKMLRRILGDDVRLYMLLPNDPLRVFADATQLEQIVVNLAINARDAMPDGGQLVIELSGVSVPRDTRVESLAPGDYVRLEVRDTGCGMNEQTRELVFEPFFTTKPHGNGLGLAMVFGIAKQSGGHVVVDSREGEGTCFYVYLPRTDRQADAIAQPAPTPASLRGRETVLLVETDEQVREATRAILTRHGYTVLDAQNGGEAMLIGEKFEGSIDLLMTNSAMPHMSGPELGARILAQRPTTKLLFVSSGESSAERLQHGEHLVLRKPFVPETLLTTVRAALERNTKLAQHSDAAAR